MKKFFNKLIEKSISPNQLYILYCIREGQEAQFVNLFVELRALRTVGYLDKYNKLTEKATSLMNEMEPLFDNTPVKHTSEEELLAFINSYYEMWPRIKLGSGKYARADKKNLQIAFKWFFKTYDYSHETVLAATAAYLNEFEAQNWEYMRTSQYFIRKGDTSDLASYCSIIDSGIDPNEDNRNHFPDKVV